MFPTLLFTKEISELKYLHPYTLYNLILNSNIDKDNNTEVKITKLTNNTIYTIIYHIDKQQ